MIIKNTIKFNVWVGALVQAGVSQASSNSNTTQNWLTPGNLLLFLMLVLVVALVIKVKKTASSLNKVREDLNHMSRTDYLTQLFKRQYFEKRLYEVFERYIRKKSSNSVLMMIEIDNMDETQSSGQTASELVIQRVVKVILERVRNTDLSGRFTESCFIVLLRDTTIEPAEKLADELKDKIADTEIEYGEKTIGTTCSFGLAAYSEKMDSCIDWIQSADQALNAAKKQGPNKISTYQN